MAYDTPPAPGGIESPPDSGNLWDNVKGFGWGDALRAAANVAELSAKLRQNNQVIGVGGVAPVGKAGATSAPFGTMPSRSPVRAPGSIGSALLGR